MYFFLFFLYASCYIVSVCVCGFFSVSFIRCGNKSLVISLFRYSNYYIFIIYIFALLFIPMFLHSNLYIFFSYSLFFLSYNTLFFSRSIWRLLLMVARHWFPTETKRFIYLLLFYINTILLILLLLLQNQRFNPTVSDFVFLIHNLLPLL